MHIFVKIVIIGDDIQKKYKLSLELVVIKK